MGEDPFPYSRALNGIKKRYITFYMFYFMNVHILCMYHLHDFSHVTFIDLSHVMYVS